MAALGAWLVFEDEAGFSMTPPTTRTWSRRGHTPVVRVRGRSRRRLSVAALACYKPGQRPRLIYRPCPDARPDGRKSFSWKDYRDLVIRAHTQLGGPIVLVWDNLRMHLVAPLRAFFEANTAWLSVFQLPTYASGPQPAGGRLVTGHTRHRQPRRRRPQPDHPRGETQAQDAAVPAGGDGCLTGTGLNLSG